MNPEIQKYIQDYVDKMQTKGITPTMEQINEHLAGFMHDINNRPREEFESYSPMEMSKILDYAFDNDSPVQFNLLSSQEYNQMPLFRQVKHLLQTLVKSEVKLTAAGYLPTKIVKELYPLGIGDPLIDSGRYNLNKEVDSTSVILTRIVLEAAGLSKIRKGILSATTNGIKIANEDSKLFMQLFQTFCYKFNWAYFDGYQSEKIGRFGFGFSLILLKKYGSQKKEDNFYAQKYFKALPMLVDGIASTYKSIDEYSNDCYSIRTFDRFMLHFSLVEIFKEQKYDSPKYISKTALFDKLITILPHREFRMGLNKLH